MGRMIAEMDRIIVRRPGGLDRLELDTAPDPTPAAGEILVEVEAAGVNFADCVVRMGLYSSAKKYVGWPITPGFEAAGRVAALGTGVAGPAPGTRVVAVTRFGGYASRLVVPAAQVFALPDDIDLRTAAGFPTVFLTAWYALFELGRPRAGSTMLVHSAAGGAGGALLQLARIADVRAVGVVGAPHKVDAARASGAAEVIDKSREDWKRAARRCAPDGYAAVFDANGATTLRGSYDLLAPTGRLVVYGFASMLARSAARPNPLRLLWGWLRTPRFNPLTMTERNLGVLAFDLSYLFEERALLEEGMGRLLRWLREGRIRLPEPACTPLARAAGAHRDLQSGRTTGKLVLTMR
ncbi:MAG: zinc-binding dehydrogenase [Planctomycetaceae bacterium]